MSDKRLRVDSQDQDGLLVNDSAPTPAHMTNTFPGS